MAEPHRSLNHTALEDAQAMLLGTALCALGVQFLSFGGLITGQTAGLGVLLSYLSGWSFGVWFFVLNLPFYILGFLRMGARFTVRSFVAVSLVSALAELFSRTIAFEALPLPIAAPLAGAVTGLGLIVVFRHGASLGGVGILALLLQERTGFRAGWTQLIFDAVLFTVALFVLPLPQVLWSLLGAVITNTIIAVNHRTDRYVAR